MKMWIAGNKILIENPDKVMVGERDADGLVSMWSSFKEPARVEIELPSWAADALREKGIQDLDSKTRGEA